MNNATEQSLYDTLGIDKSATSDEIKKAYRKKASETHPDSETGDNTDFLNVHKAYSILSDTKSRLYYDRTGKLKDENTPDNLKVKAMREIQILLIQLLDNSTDEIFYGNLPDHVLSIINANIEQASGNIATAKKRINRLRRFKKRFKHKATPNTENDFIDIGLNAQMHSTKSTVYDEIDKIEVFKKMLELLADYEYEPETKAAVFSMANITIGGFNGRI